MIEYRKLSPEWAAQMAELYREAGWLNEAEDSGFIVKTLSSSLWIGAVEGKVLLGMGRAITDAVSDAYIQDITVRSAFRKQGIGRTIVTKLVAELQKSGVDWIGLVGVPGTENFYRSLGFEPLTGHTAYKFKNI